MRLLGLRVSSFRNLKNLELTPGARFNVFYGNNGQGKTNLLESIYLLSTMKSFKLARNAELITFGADFSLIRGVVEKDCVKRDISLLLEKQGKKGKVDGKIATRMDDFFGNLNVVVFTPEEISMVRGAPELRRRYLDRAVFTGDLGYLALFHDYSKILKNRNALLKRGELSGLDVWSEQLAHAAAGVVARRVAYLEEMQGLLQFFYKQISGNDEEVVLSYRLNLMEREAYLADPEETLLKTLKAHAAEEKRRGTTVAGPHRDDIYFALDGRPVRHFGSQGQQRSFVLALKMAEIEYLHRRFGAPPVLLLDDMTSELDRERNANLMEFLKNREMQVFITTTALQNVPFEEGAQHRAFQIREGRILH
ncbi:DNA replication/repair protein RecF [Geomonas sp. RF6]|uniref:DNA replication/repair protein RecF n=1 Tax=Geomonas sp. RF6 TaxID=2897342 RepID=UPI001E406DB2|nr:DNA replication/repair protein RecF [Geomonas sp. RF6]UFS72187.1 DNA replication/repair protein RecF [Geomonas sp. RF6]